MEEINLKEKTEQEDFIKQHTLSQDEFLKLVKEKIERARLYSFSVKQREAQILLED